METNRPKPHPPIKKLSATVALPDKETAEAPVPLPVGEDHPAKPAEKRPFIPKPHLTERPFQNHEGLQALKDSITPAKKPERRTSRFPRRNTTQKGAK